MARYRNHDHGRRVNDNHRRCGRDMQSPPPRCVRDTLTEVSRLMVEVRDFKRTVFREKHRLLRDRNGTTGLKLFLKIVRNYIRDIEDLLTSPTASSSDWHPSSSTSSDSSSSSSSSSSLSPSPSPSPPRHFRSRPPVVIGRSCVSSHRYFRARSPVLPARSHDSHRSHSRSPPNRRLGYPHFRSPVSLEWSRDSHQYSLHSRSAPSTQSRSHSPVRRPWIEYSSPSPVRRPPSSQLSPSRRPSRSPSTRRPWVPTLPRS